MPSPRAPARRGPGAARLLALALAAVCAACLAPRTLQAQTCLQSITDPCEPPQTPTPPLVDVSPATGAVGDQQMMVDIYWQDSNSALVESTRSITVAGGDSTAAFTWDPFYAGGRLTDASSQGAVTLPANGADLVVSAHICNNDGLCTTTSATYHYEPPPLVIAPSSVARPQGESLLETFRVVNVGSRTVTYAFSGACDWPVDPCVPSVSQLTLAPGDTGLVGINYRLQSGGIGSLGLSVGSTAGQWYASTIVIPMSAAGAPGGPRDRADLSLLDRALCVTTQVGPGAAFQCGDLRLAHALPSARVLNTPQTPMLVYSSQTAKPYPIVAAHVPRDTGMPRPDSLAGTLTVEGVVVARGKWRGFPGDTARVALGYDASAKATGLYGYTLEVTAYYGASPEVLYSRTGRLAVVNRSDSYFGRGWWLSGLERLVPVNEEELLWVGSDGSTRRYSLTVDETGWAGPFFDRPDTIRSDGAGGYVRSVPGGTRVYFDAAGLHRRTVDALGRTLTYGYAVNAQTGALQLTQLQLPGTSLAYTFNYTGGSPNAGPGKLAEVVAPGNRGLADSARVVRLEMTGADLTRIWDPQYRHDVAQGSALDYTRPHVYFPAAGGRVTARYDRSNVPTFFRYDAAGLLTGTALPLAPGDSIKLGFRAAESQGLSSIVAQADVYTWIDGPRPVADTTRYWLDRWQAPVRVVDAVGRATVLRRGGTRLPGLVTSVTYPGGRQLTATYDDRGHLLSTTDWGMQAANGMVPTNVYGYDTRCDKTNRVVLPEGETTRTVYNQYCQPTAIQRGSDPARTTRMAYNPVNLGTPSAGMVQSVTYPTVGGTTPVEQYSYDALGNLSLVVTPRGNRIAYGGDAMGRPVLHRVALQPGVVLLGDPNSQRDSTVYDVNGRVQWSESYGPPLNGAREQRLQTSRTYDREGRLKTLSRTSVPDSAGVGTLTTTWRYDAAGRIVAEVAADGKRDSTEYDAAGNTRTLVTRREQRVTFTYDDLNRLTTRTVLPFAYTARYEGIPAHYGLGYAACGTSVSPLQRTYPSLPNDGGCGYTAPGEQATFTYDPVTSLVATANNGDVQVSRTYFPNGRVRTETQKIRDASGTDFSKHVYTLEYAYDLDGRRISLTHPTQLAPAGGWGSTQYLYDHDTGELQRVVDALGNQFSFTYDAQGQIASLTRPGGVVDTYGYNADGLLRTLGTSGGRRTYTLDYDTRGKVVQALGPGVRDSVNATYSGLGQTVGTTSVIWGNGTDPAFRGSESYRYDAMSNAYGSSTSAAVPCFCVNQPATTHVTLTSGTPQYAGGAGRLSSSSEWTRIPYDNGTRDVTHQSLWTYNLEGDQEFATQAYQATGSCDSQSKDQADCEDLASFYDGDGTLRAAEHRSREGTDGGGRWEDVFEEYRYDALGRRAWVRTRVTCGGTTGVGAPKSCQSTIRRTVWDGQHELYEIQMPGEDGSAYLENDTGALPIRTYTATWPYGPTPQPMPTNFFEWDPNAAFGRVAYTHALGVDQPVDLVRIALQRYWPEPYSAGQATSFSPFAMSVLWDWRGQADISVSMTGASNHCQTFSGTSRCVFVQGQRNSWQAYEIGSFYSKAAGWHGTLITGKRDETGTMYRRARYYDPQTGRFTQEDPIGLAGGLNLYAYGNGDAINSSDPSGLCPICIGALAGAAIGAGAYFVFTPRSERSWGRFAAFTLGGAAIGATAGAAAGVILAAAPEAGGTVGAVTVVTSDGAAATVAESAAEIAEAEATQAVASTASSTFGELIGWGTGQTEAAIAKTEALTESLTSETVQGFVERGLSREWVEGQLRFYERSLAEGGRKLVNKQLIPRLHLMRRILELWPK
ncbi:MAG TPA: RHS repeat-associated core domain-containing protein [Longimicrobium sp.]|nr:RHS repeat-associated core domain-containing protein [Longimicrobium sp.]